VSDQVTVQRLIPAPADRIFDLLADPDGHVRIDGGDSVRKARSGGRRLKLGDAFGMDMHLGASYSTRNEVIEFEEDRLIAWRTVATGLLKPFIGGRVWRYELEPRDGGTLVRETWDISGEALTSKPGVRRMADMTRRNMEATLARIEELLAEE